MDLTCPPGVPSCVMYLVCFQDRLLGHEGFSRGHMVTAYDLMFGFFDLLVNEGFASIDLPDQSVYRSPFSHILVLFAYLKGR